MLKRKSGAIGREGRRRGQNIRNETYHFVVPFIIISFQRQNASCATNFDLQRFVQDKHKAFTFAVAGWKQNGCFIFVQ